MDRIEHRIVWRFREGVLKPSDSRKLPQELVTELLGPFAVDDPDPSPVFMGALEEVEKITGAVAREFGEDSANDAARYYQVRLRDRGMAREIAAQLRAREALIEYVDVHEEGAEYLPPPPESCGMLDPAVCKPNASANAPSKPYHGCQVYLADASRNGIDVGYAWKIKGGRGGGVRLVDVEKGWNLTHEDLVDRVVRLRPIGPGGDHGTAVLGICHGAPNGIGVVGIAHAAAAAVLLPHDKWGKENVPGAIRWLADLRVPPEVMLLELQFPSESGPLLPVEAFQDGRLAIRYAVARQIHVVEAAANGGTPLDWPEESGAILVGAGSPRDRSRRSGSNFGRRVHVQGWGDCVVTTGGKSRPEFSNLQTRDSPSRCYTRSFDGTSSAAAIVAGVVTCISGVLRAHAMPALSPGAMRSLLIRTGLPQHHPDPVQIEHIGPLPNLKRALKALGQQRGALFDRHPDQPQPGVAWSLDPWR